MARERLPERIATLWDHPELTVAIFELHLTSAEGGALYEASGIGDEIEASLAVAEGHLATRRFTTPTGGVLLQYWRSFVDLERFSRTMPHTAWWSWLVEHAGHGVGFSHEIYQARTAEAIFSAGAIPVGPGTFCDLEPAEGSRGRSVERQRRFLAGAPAVPGGLG